MVITEWFGDDLWNLLNLPNDEVYRLYEQYYEGNPRDRRSNIRRIANKKRKQLKTGRIKMPERSTPYDPEQEPKHIERRRAKNALNIGGQALDTTVITVPVEHLSYHEKLQAALNEDGAVSKMRISEYQMGYKDADGEAQSHDLRAVRFELEFDSEPKWPLPTRVESVKLQRKEPLKETDTKTCIIFPDVQIPFQDEQALAVALEIMQKVKPDRVVFLGDLLDLSAWGRFIQQPEWATATQGAINRAHQLLAAIRKALPTAEIQVMAGNHEERMPKTLLANARAAYGLKRADSLDGWPVMSVPFLCAFDQLDVEYLPGYPANRIWLNRNLQIRHGMNTRKKGGSSRGALAAEKVSTIFGHDHRISSSITTLTEFDGGKQIHAYGSGCLCRLDGHVPSYHSGKDLDGAPVEQYEDWQHGFVLATYDESNFHVEQVPISTFNGYQTMFRGKVYGI